MASLLLSRVRVSPGVRPVPRVWWRLCDVSIASVSLASCQPIGPCRAETALVGLTVLSFGPCWSAAAMN